jgi:hypothetical protein
MPDSSAIGSWMESAVEMMIRQSYPLFMLRSLLITSLEVAQAIDMTGVFCCDFYAVSPGRREAGSVETAVNIGHGNHKIVRAIALRVDFHVQIA